ncbi:Uncharacterised protein [Mycobacteroides abscessus subsp. abscessus]|nr:Uncharacterised protein [Mycobacteroides abscessus subsp. abscessus]
MPRLPLPGAGAHRYAVPQLGLHRRELLVLAVDLLGSGIEQRQVILKNSHFSSSLVPRPGQSRV